MSGLISKLPTVGYVAFIVLYYCFVSQVFIYFPKSHFKDIYTRRMPQTKGFQVNRVKWWPVKAKGKLAV